MRSVRVVLPESMCALIPMFRRFDSSLVTAAPCPPPHRIDDGRCRGKCGASYKVYGRFAPGKLLFLAKNVHSRGETEAFACLAKGVQRAELVANCAISMTRPRLLQSPGSLAPDRIRR